MTLTTENKNTKIKFEQLPVDPLDWILCSLAILLSSGEVMIKTTTTSGLLKGDIEPGTWNLKTIYLLIIEQLEQW